MTETLAERLRDRAKRNNAHIKLDKVAFYERSDIALDDEAAAALASTVPGAVSDEMVEQIACLLMGRVNAPESEIYGVAREIVALPARRPVASAEADGQHGSVKALETIEAYVAGERDRYRDLLNQGKGEHCQPGYVRDETWASWNGKFLLADDILTVATREADAVRESVLAEARLTQAVEDGMVLVPPQEQMNQAFYVDVCNAESRIKEFVAVAQALLDTLPDALAELRADALPKGHTILEQAEMFDGRVSQTVRIDASGGEYNRIVHADEAFGDRS